MYIWIVKLITFIGTLLSSLVYNFHKPIKNIKTKRNLKYKRNHNFHNLMDVHFDKTSKDANKPCIIYFHGGGWCSYSKGIYTTLCRRMAKMGYVVFNVNYPLAPQHKMEEILSDAVLAIKFVRSVAHEYGADADKITLAGDSAGAHISSAITAMIQNGEIDFPEIRDKIKCLILLYGVFDLETMQTSGFVNIRTYAKAVLGKNYKNKELTSKFSPVHKISENFPPCFMASGEIDKLHASQSLQMSKILKEKGVKVDELFFEKEEKRAMHAYMIFDGLETNQVTLNRIEKFLKEVYK